MDILKDCTEEQHEAITHIDGPLIILAGAGSGKTRVIAFNIMLVLFCRHFSLALCPPPHVF